MNNEPSLSIGFPVYNGEKYIKSALDSILNQTYTNYEIIIADNLSTDNTSKICKKYVKKDGRISFYQNKKNIGAPANYNLTFKLSKGKYFKWAAHDDIIAPDYFSKCINILEKEPSIVLCHSKIGKINEQGQITGNFDEFALHNIGSIKPHERLEDMISRRNSCWSIMGIMRTKCLAKTPLHGNYIDADRNLLAELSLLGKIHEIPEHLFFMRDHAQSYTNTYYSGHTLLRDYRKQLIWWTGNNKSRILVLPHWKNFLEYIKSINRVPLKIKDKLLCYRAIGRWLIRERGWQLMKWDLTNEFHTWRIFLNNRLNFFSNQ